MSDEAHRDDADYLGDLERQGELLAAILGLDPSVHLRCRGRPGECGDACDGNSCPLVVNRLQDVGTMVSAMLEEFRWHRAWAEELDSLGVVPQGTLDRVAKRVERSMLHDRLREALEASDAIQGVQVLRERFVSRITEIRADIEAIDRQLGESRGAKE